MRCLAMLWPILTVSTVPSPPWQPGGANVPPSPAPPPPYPPPTEPLPPPPPLDEDAQWRALDALVDAEEASAALPMFNFTDFNGAPAAPAEAKRCERSVRLALHQTRLGLGPRVYADRLDEVQIGNRDRPDDPRVVYFVMLSRQSSHLTVSRLVHALYHPSHLFLLHLDVKLNAIAADAIRGYVKTLSNVHVMRTRRLVQWGAFTMVC
ncbi:hypothetical protein T492DRAFT_523129 [Pavlovales sp. CCMP2436]|nr:hypothetical protein T492DRAFT_523129 [Pavlovales sp. CCMP2436]